MKRTITALAGVAAFSVATYAMLGKGSPAYAEGTVMLTVLHEAIVDGKGTVQLGIGDSKTFELSAFSSVTDAEHKRERVRQFGVARALLDMVRENPAKWAVVVTNNGYEISSINEALESHRVLIPLAILDRWKVTADAALKSATEHAKVQEVTHASFRTMLESADANKKQKDEEMFDIIMLKWPDIREVMLETRGLVEEAGAPMPEGSSARLHELISRIDSMSWQKANSSHVSGALHLMTAIWRASKQNAADAWAAVEIEYDRRHRDILKKGD